MITVPATARSKTSTRHTPPVDRVKDQYRMTDADTLKPVGAMLVAPDDPDALPGRGRWAECY